MKMLFRERKQIVICIVAGAMLAGFLLFCYIPLRKKVEEVEQVKANQMFTIVKASIENKQLPVFDE